MVRTYKKKRTGPDIDEENMEKALGEYFNNKVSFRVLAEKYGFQHTTLFYRIKNYRKSQERKGNYQSKHSVNQVFTKQQEAMLEKYILKCSKMSYGLTYIGIRKLAYEYANKLGCCPNYWKGKETAGLDWLKGFMKRHTTLSLRKPENTSLSRATSFTPANVEAFQSNYSDVLDKFKLKPNQIYNLDETSVSTVLQAPNVVAEKGVKQVSQAVSAERGQCITMCAIISACGNALPPVFIFPRARMNDTYMINAPEGSVGLANSPSSGWMTGPLFVNVLEHVQSYTKCSKDDPILILMDNHETHCTLSAVLYARENGIVLLTFPPHCSHRLQPLDVGVFGPFKSKLAICENDWLLTHPGKTIGIPQLVGICKDAFDVSFTRRNIISSFQKPGIWPFSRTAFTEDDFHCCEVTDRPIAVPLEVNISNQGENQLDFQENNRSENGSSLIDNPNSTLGIDLSHTERAKASTARRAINFSDDEEEMIRYHAINEPTNSSLEPLPSCSRSSLELPPKSQLESQPLCTNDSREKLLAEPLSPECVRPFPKAEARKECVRARKKGKSRILTDTPEKDRLELETKERLDKKKPKSGSRRKPKKDKTAVVESSSSDSDANISLHDDSDTFDISDSDISLGESSAESLGVNDYVLVKFASKKQNLYYVGKIKAKYPYECDISFMKKLGNTKKFIFSKPEDVWPIPNEDIISKLPCPKSTGKTARASNIFTFNVNFGTFKMG